MNLLLQDDDGLAVWLFSLLSRPKGQQRSDSDVWRLPHDDALSCYGQERE